MSGTCSKPTTYNVTATFRPLEPNAYKFSRVSDASLGEVDMFGDPTEVESEAIKGYSQAFTCIILREKSMMSGSRGRFNVLESDSKTITRDCRSNMAAKTRGLGMLTDSSEFHVDFCRMFLESQDLQSSGIAMGKASAPWPRMIVTDARDGHDKLATEKG